MALSVSSIPVSSPNWSLRSLSRHHHVPAGRKTSPGSTVGFVFGSRTTSIGSSQRHRQSPLFSLSFGQNGWSCSTRPQKITICNSLQGGPLGEGPNVENKKPGPQLGWVLLAAGVTAVAAVVLLKLNGGRLANLGVPGHALALQADPGLVPAVSPEGPGSFNVKLPGLGMLSLGEVTPGWVYFLLLMAAGFGLFVSEEALNVWVGASLGRLLNYGSRQDVLASLSANAPYIISTILWVYWGVCISDMIPFYAGKLASRSGDQLSQKLGVSKEKHEELTRKIQKYGNLIGFVERFSIGVRNPTSFLAGVAGISPAKFFAGVCVGGLFTLPLQMSVGFALRERPVAALAMVGAVVGTWTVFPYAVAGIVSLYYLIVRNIKPSQ